MRELKRVSSETVALEARRGPGLANSSAQYRVVMEEQKNWKMCALGRSQAEPEVQTRSRVESMAMVSTDAAYAQPKAARVTKERRE